MSCVLSRASFSQSCLYLLNMHCYSELTSLFQKDEVTLFHWCSCHITSEFSIGGSMQLSLCCLCRLNIICIWKCLLLKWLCKEHPANTLMLSPLGKNEKIKRLCSWNLVSDFLPLHVQAWRQDLKLIHSESQVIERGFCVGWGWFLHPASWRIVRNPRKRRPYHVTILLAENKVNQQQKIYPQVSSFLSFILKFLLWVVLSNMHRQTQLTTCLQIWHIHAV